MIDNTLKLVGLSLCLGILAGNYSENCFASELTEDEVEAIRRAYPKVENGNLEEVNDYEKKIIYSENIEEFLEKLPENIKNKITVREASDGRKYLCYKPELVIGYVTPTMDMEREYLEGNDRGLMKTLRELIGSELGEKIKELVRGRNFQHTWCFKSEEDLRDEEFWMRCFFYLLSSNSYNAFYLDVKAGKSIDDYIYGLKDRS